MFMVRCQFCSMSSAAFCALAAARDTAAGDAAAVEGVEVGLKEFTAPYGSHRPLRGKRPSFPSLPWESQAGNTYARFRRRGIPP